MSDQSSVTDLKVWREANYKERQKLAKAAMKEFYRKPKRKSVSDDLSTTQINLERLKHRLIFGTASGTLAARYLGQIMSDLSSTTCDADNLERKHRKARRKLRRAV